jgi:hypothetical protein
MAVATYLHQKQAEKYADEEQAGGATGDDDGEVQVVVMLQSESSSSIMQTELIGRPLQYCSAFSARL